MLKKISIATTEVDLPIEKTTVEVVPFTARIEKELLTVNQKDHQAIANAITNLIAACIQTDGFDNKRVSSLAATDALWIYLNLNAISIGDTKKLTLICDAQIDDPESSQNKIKCGTSIPVTVKLSDVTVTDEMPPEYVELSDGTKIFFNFPTIKQQLNFDTNRKEDREYLFNQSTNLIADCVKTIVQGDTVLAGKDIPKKELVEWIYDLQHYNFEALSGWFSKIPKPLLTVKYKCPSCGHEHTKKVEDVISFFR